MPGCVRVKLNPMDDLSRRLIDKADNLVRDTVVAVQRTKATIAETQLCVSGAEIARKEDPYLRGIEGLRLVSGAGCRA